MISKKKLFFIVLKIKNRNCGNKVYNVKTTRHSNHFKHNIHCKILNHILFQQELFHVKQCNRFLTFESLKLQNN